MNYGKKSTQKREKELTSKSTMIRKKFYVIFCKSLLVCVFAVMVIGACSGVGVIRGIIASAPTIDDIVATPTGFLSTVLDANGNQTATLVASGSNRALLRSMRYQRICSMHSLPSKTNVFTSTTVSM